MGRDDIGSRGEEWRKLVDDFISNEIVQVDEEFAGDSPLSWPTFVESYINRECGFEIIYRLSVRHKQTHDFRTIISSACTNSASPNAYLSPWSHAQTSACLTDNNDSGRLMFVVVPESVKYVQRMPFVVIPSIVRLEIFNKGLGIRRKASVPLQYFTLEPILIDTNGESKLTIRRFTTDLPKIPDKIIKNRPKIVDGVPYEEAQVNGWLLVDSPDIAYMIASTLRIYLGNHTVRVCFEEGVGFTYELLYVLPRPIDPRMGNFHVISHKIVLPEGDF